MKNEHKLWDLMLHHIQLSEDWQNILTKVKMNDVNDDYRSGRPASVLTNENIERVWQVIKDDPHSTDNDIIAKTLSLSLSLSWYNRTNYSWLYKIRKVTSRWLLINSMTNRSKNDLEFVVKILQNFEIEYDDHVIILLTAYLEPDRQKPANRYRTGWFAGPVRSNFWYRPVFLIIFRQ